MQLPAFLSRILGIQPAAIPVSQPSTAKVTTMTTLSDDFKAIEAHLVAAEPEIKAKWAELVAWVASKMATDAAEIADLVSKGYIVTPPAALAVPPAV